ncbi:hypothetical protein SDC9_210618 [bioreactor metagenome]|uniref:Uncharacterized protein n=1 Tax=bioreactor metagenome TaxID=1076179 RepID=A0A645JGQ5_9ZZZZ
MEQIGTGGILLSGPRSRLHLFVERNDIAQDVKHQGNSQLGDRHAVAADANSNGDAAFSGGLNVYLVVANPPFLNPFDMGRGVHDLCIDHTAAVDHIVCVR